jgi:hypothetical protein
MQQQTADRRSASSYRKPELTVLGDLTRLTKAVGCTGGDDGNRDHLYCGFGGGFGPNFYKTR